MSIDETPDPVPLPLTEEQFNEFEFICDLGREKFAAILQALQSSTTSIYRADVLSNTIEEAIGQDAETLLSCALLLYGWANHTDTALEDILTSLDATIQSSDWAAERKERWGEVRASFTNLLMLPAFHLTATSSQLYSERTNSLRDCKVSTDVCPIFDQEITEIQGTVVLHQLKLVYSGSEGEIELGLTLDGNDLQKLIAQCEKAIARAGVARSFFRAPTAVPCIEFGNETDQSS